MFEEMMKDRVIVRKENGEEFSDVEASVQRNKIFIFRADIPIERGDKIIRTTPAGVEEEYIVEDPGFRSEIEDIPGHYQMTVSPA